MNGSYQITVLSTSRAFSLLGGKKLGQVTSNGIEVCEGFFLFNTCAIFCLDACVTGTKETEI